MFVKHPFAPDRLLTQNSELRKAGVFGWTLPAFITTLSDGSRFNCCPNAGPCARVCYARFGTYRFRNVIDRHVWNLEYILLHPDAWQEQMVHEISHRRMDPTFKPHDLDHDPADRWVAEWVANGGRAVRIHDSGDFFTRDYLTRWFEIARTRPEVLFYAYTKEVEMVRRALPDAPANFRPIFSLGGKQDDLIHRDTERHADVFPTDQALQAAGYYNQEANDLLAAVAPSVRIGIVQNNIPVAVKRFGGRSMSQMIDRETPAPS